MEERLIHLLICACAWGIIVPGLLAWKCDNMKEERDQAIFLMTVCQRKYTKLIREMANASDYSLAKTRKTETLILQACDRIKKLTTKINQPRSGATGGQNHEKLL